MSSEAASTLGCVTAAADRPWDFRRRWLRSRLRALGRTGPLRVLIAGNSLGRGGAEHQIARLMPHLGELGLSVEHFYHSGPHGLRPRLEQCGVRSHFLDKGRLGQQRFWCQLLSLMRRERYDVVHAFTGTANVYAGGAALLTGVPVVLGGWRNRVMAGGLPMRLALSLVNACNSGWVVNASTNAEALGRLWHLRRPKVHVVANALDPRDHRAPGEPWADAELSEWIGDRLVIGAVGSLTTQKDPELFLDMAGALRHLADRTCFCWVGGAPQRQAELAARLHRRIAVEGLAGHVRLLAPTDDVGGFLDLLSAFVLTSRWEGCPNAVTEAMRAGLPIVMTDCTDTAKLVEWDRNGYVVPPGRVGPLALRVEQLLADPERRRRFGERSQALCRRHFDAADNAWELAKVYVHEWERARGGPATASPPDVEPRPSRAARARALKQKLQLSRTESEPYAWHVVRRVSIHVTLLLARLGVSPNAVTLLAMALGLAGACAWALGTDLGFVAGGMLFQLMYLFDCCDGELARHLDRTSPRGAFLDLTGHFFVNSAMVLGAGIGLARGAGPWVLWLSAGALLALLGDEYGRGVLLRVAQKAGKGLADAHEHGSFRSMKSRSRVYEVAAFLCGAPGLFTGMLAAAAADLALPGDSVKLTFMVGWTVIVLAKFAARLRQAYLYLPGQEGQAS